MSQHMDALSKANYVRLERAQIKRDIGSGKATVVDVLECKPFVCDTMTIMELLCSQKRWARTRSLKFLSHVQPINESRQLCKLTERERNLLISTLRRW